MAAMSREGSAAQDPPPPPALAPVPEAGGHEADEAGAGSQFERGLVSEKAHRASAALLRALPCLRRALLQEAGQHQRGVPHHRASPAGRTLRQPEDSGAVPPGQLPLEEDRRLRQRRWRWRHEGRAGKAGLVFRRRPLTGS